MAAPLSPRQIAALRRLASLPEGVLYGIIDDGRTESALERRGLIVMHAGDAMRATDRHSARGRTPRFRLTNAGKRVAAELLAGTER